MTGANAKQSLSTLLTALLCTGLVAACSNSTSISHSYIDPQIKKMDLQGVLVVAVAQKKSTRVEFEDGFAAALSRHGVEAVASHTLVPGKKPGGEEIIAAAENANLDTIMVTRYLGEMSEEVYHPGKVYYGVTPMYGGPYYGGFGGYYAHAYEIAYQQPVWTNNVTHTLVSDLYVAATKKHLWQAVSDTIQAGSLQEVREDAIAGIIGQLKSQGLVN